MVAKVYTFLKGLALAAFVFLSTIVGISVWSNHNHANSLLDSLHQNSIELNKTLIELNKPKIGVVSQVYELIHQSRLTIDVFNNVAIDEQKYLEVRQPLEVTRLNESLDKVNTAITSAITVINTVGNSISSISTNANTSLDNLNTAIGDLHPLLVESTQTLSSAKTLLDNQDIPATLNNFKDTSANAKVATGDLKDMVADTKDYWHKFLHPTWPQKVYSAVTNVGLKIGLAVW